MGLKDPQPISEFGRAGLCGQHVGISLVIGAESWAPIRPTILPKGSRLYTALRLVNTFSEVAR